MQLITTTAELENFCGHILEALEESENFITIDTEFQRERTYYPQLCLIQVATAAQIAIIDALSPGISLERFWAILQNPAILKVLHAGRQDIEIFHLLTGQIPTPVFDTQIAATVCGFGESIGYEALVQHYTRQSLDKSMQKADWSKRPLNTRQLEYAANDVKYLREIYQAIRDYLAKSGRSNWFEDDLKVLENPSTYIINNELLWKRLKFKYPHAEFLVRLQAITKLREQWAQERNVPRGRIMDDDTVLEFASYNSVKMEALPSRLASRLKGISQNKIELLIKACEDALLQPRELWPQINSYKPPKTASPQLFGFLEYFLHLRSEQLRIVPRLLANRDELVQLLFEQDQANVRCLQGWRYENFGRDALALIRGEIALKIDGKKVVAVGQEKHE